MSADWQIDDVVGFATLVTFYVEMRVRRLTPAAALRETARRLCSKQIERDWRSRRHLSPPPRAADADSVFAWSAFAFVGAGSREWTV